MLLLTRFRIAVFDSDESARISMSSRLARLASEGYRLDIETFSNLPALKGRFLEQRFDLICSDLSDGHSEDRSGLSLLQSIVAEEQGPLLFVANAARTPFRGLVIAAGAFDYVEKSASDEAILALVRQALDS